MVFFRITLFSFTRFFFEDQVVNSGVYSPEITHGCLSLSITYIALGLKLRWVEMKIKLGAWKNQHNKRFYILGSVVNVFLSKNC